MLIFRFFSRRAAALLAMGVSTSCASREVPVRFPESSPASVEAHPGQAASVLRALDADPGPPPPAQAGSGNASENVPNAQGGHDGHQH